MLLISTAPPGPTSAPIFFQPVVTDWVAPVILLLLGSVGKKVARGRGWNAEDFYLGPDLCLAGTLAGLLKLFDLLKRLPVPADKVNTLVYDIALAAILLIVTMIMFVLVLSLHQDFSEQMSSLRAKLWLGLGCNFVGLACLTAFLLLIKWD